MSSPQPHAWVRPKWLRRWDMCNRCGLVALRNDFSQWCSQNGCNYDEHPDYASAYKRFAGKKL